LASSPERRMKKKKQLCADRRSVPKDAHAFSFIILLSLGDNNPKRRDEELIDFSFEELLRGLLFPSANDTINFLSLITTGVTFSFFLFLFHKRALQGVMKKKKEKEEK
jgi:hypothetical protein